ncbi:MAG: MoaD/ThiS family protein [Burkholderiaceae bacterium]|nr:MoaD/ThiS family protein [Burkholderiaceae bacterium]
MKIQVRYFASIREVLGAGESIEVAAETTVGEVRDRLIASSAAHATALARGRALRSALNQALCDESTVVTGDAEVAFFPPVTGG